MKSFLLSLVLLFTVVVIKAQVNLEKVANLNRPITIVPPNFSKDKRPLLISPKESYGEYEVYNVYDSEMRLVRNFKMYYPKFHPIEMRFIDYDSGTSFIAPNNTILNNFRFTQTLFNEDEKIEFVSAAYSDPNNTDTWGVYIINEDGEFLQKLDIGSDFKLILKMNGCYYIATMASDGGYDFYKITKNIDSTGTNAITVSNSQNGPTQFFDLAGKSVNPDTAKGKVIIKTNGTSSSKILVK